MGTVKINTGYTPEEMKNSEWFGSGGGMSVKTPDRVTDINVGSKTPEEIKNGLRTARHVQCMEISDDDENGRTRYGVLIGYVLRDKIFAYIQQLESRLAQVERERDAAVYDIEPSCDYCAFVNNTYGEAPCPTEEELETDGFCIGFKWRGVCPENTKEETK